MKKIILVTTLYLLAHSSAEGHKHLIVRNKYMRMNTIDTSVLSFYSAFEIVKQKGIHKKDTILNGVPMAGYYLYRFQNIYLRIDERFNQSQIKVMKGHLHFVVYDMGQIVIWDSVFPWLYGRKRKIDKILEKLNSRGIFSKTKHEVKLHVFIFLSNFF